MKQSKSAKIIDRISTGTDYYQLILENPFDSECSPGQFVMISLDGVFDPFLKRPYSIYKSHPISEKHPKGELHLLIRQVGRGSKQMAEVPVGSTVSIIGPLGTSFKVDENIKTALFVAGGIGVAPFVEFSSSDELRNVKKIALIGGRNINDIQAVKQLENNGVQIFVATEDGSLGVKGLVTNLLNMQISKLNLADTCVSDTCVSDTCIYCCGPKAMMKAVGKIAAKHKIPCQVSLESVMGCGFGVCLGCVQEDQDGNFIRVCKEGPVIEARKLSGYGFDEERS